MRYRKLTPDGDYTFGSGFYNFWIDQPEAVAQACATRLKLWLGEWFVDQTQGMPWLTQVIGTGTVPLYDTAIRSHILDTQGVEQVVSYASFLNPNTRNLSVAAEIDTIYGQARVTVELTPTPLGR